ncbi:hypothetical protein [Paenibacillus prosopidis]|uniref:Uncharacterized protein n=1 Tax=Paenibacillus prosopidis TaxID=630520 RepID=A0A368VMS1_9BACL|nr:hypothetical protein [Paenibacillus prosopidis]RCW43009.1 hypothetical protein DFP97_11472 [Paenibacillus prosopidis]
MDWNSIALTMAGVIGSGTAVVHGLLMQRLIIKPIEAVFDHPIIYMPLHHYN